MKSVGQIKVLISEEYHAVWDRVVAQLTDQELRRALDYKLVPEDYDKPCPTKRKQIWDGKEAECELPIGHEGPHVLRLTWDDDSQ